MYLSKSYTTLPNSSHNHATSLQSPPPSQLSSIQSINCVSLLEMIVYVQLPVSSDRGASVYFRLTGAYETDIIMRFARYATQRMYILCNSRKKDGEAKRKITQLASLESSRLCAPFAARVNLSNLVFVKVHFQL